MAMARRRFDVDEVLDAVFDNDFGLSDGESSADEDGDGIYAYLGDPVVDRSSISALTSRTTIDGVDDGATIDDIGHTFEDEERVDMESSEEVSEAALTTGETTGLEVSDEYDGDDLFAGTSRADETSGDSGESMMDDDRDSNTSSDMSDSQPSTSSSSPLSTTPRGGRRGRAARTLEAVEEQSEAGAVEELEEPVVVVVDEQAEHDAVAPLADLETVEEQACLVTKIVKMNGKRKKLTHLCTRIDVLEVQLLQQRPYRMTLRLISFVVFLQTVSGSLLLTKQIVMLPKIQPVLHTPGHGTIPPSQK